MSGFKRFKNVSHMFADDMALLASSEFWFDVIDLYLLLVDCISHVVSGAARWFGG